MTTYNLGETVAAAISMELPFHDLFIDNFQENKDFGVHPKRRLLWPDHGDEVFFRNLKIREF